MLVVIKKFGSDNQWRRFRRGLLSAGARMISRGRYDVPRELLPGGKYQDGRDILVGGNSGLCAPCAIIT